MKTFLVNSNNPIPDWYKPVLVEVENGYFMEKEAACCLKKLIKDGRKLGFKLEIFSAYRTPEYQMNLFNNSIKDCMERGMTYEEALKKTKISVAEPKFSEHNTGLAVDICDTDLDIDIEMRAEYQDECEWLKYNSYRFGFIVRYPKGKENITGIEYEPWHLRYVGYPHAEIIMRKGITLEEYVQMRCCR